ncbi:MAG: NAD(P)-dependent alcohol dehydrogenase [Myxococcota bacterium]
MQAVLYDTYGPPETLRMQEVHTPVPVDDEILVQIGATTVTPVDTAFRAGDNFFARLFTGLRKPRRQILGSELAGRVVAVGPSVTRFRVGDVVFGGSDVGFGTHAEYVSLSESGALEKKPANMSIVEAATVSNGALTALPFLRDEAKLQPGDRILIIGASGSIGTMAVQLAKHLGAHVTAVCSTKNVALVESLGADEVIDYTKTDFSRPGPGGRAPYDAVFDTVGKSSFRQAEAVLAPRGIYMTTVISFAVLLQMGWTKIVPGRRAVFAATGLRSPADKRADMALIVELYQAGTLRTVIDRHYPLGQIAEAHRYVDTGHKRGNVVIDVAVDSRPAA